MYKYGENTKKKIFKYLTKINVVSSTTINRRHLSRHFFLVWNEDDSISLLLSK